MTVYILWETDPVGEQTEPIDVFSSWNKANEARKKYEAHDYSGYFDYWIERWEVK